MIFNIIDFQKEKEDKTSIKTSISKDTRKNKPLVEYQ